MMMLPIIVSDLLMNVRADATGVLSDVKFPR